MCLAPNHTTVKQKTQDLHPCLLTSNLMIIPLYHHYLCSVPNYISGAFHNLQCVLYPLTHLILPTVPLLLLCHFIDKKIDATDIR